MMKRLLIAGAVATTLSLASTPATASSTMTFNSLPADFSAYSTFTEDGITIASGNSNHFHTVGDGGGGTAAGFYQSDGFPQTVTFSGGVFTLTSIDFLSFFNGIDALLTSSSGSIETINTTGTFNFGSGFSNISFFTISSQEGGSDNSFVLDNITIAGAVPEPATWAMMLIGFGAVGAAMRRRKRTELTFRQAA